MGLIQQWLQAIQREKDFGKAMVDIHVPNTVPMVDVDSACLQVRQLGDQYMVRKLPNYPLTVRITWSR